MNKILKDALERAGMSQKELAEAIHVTPQAVSKWVNGESRPTFDNVIEINKILGVDLAKEMVRATKKGKTAMKRQHCELNDLNSIEKAQNEARLILQDAGIPTNYPHHIYALLEWLITATIGMTFYQNLRNNDHEDDYDYDLLPEVLEDFFEKEYRFKNYQSRLAYSFYLLGMDLFEANAEYEIDQEYVDYGNCAVSLWYNFERVFAPLWHSPLLDEFKVALLEVVDSLRN